MDHKPSCPRSQFWDAGEYEAPCTCDCLDPDSDDRERRLTELMRQMYEAVDAMNRALARNDSLEASRLILRQRELLEQTKELVCQ